MDDEIEDDERTAQQINSGPYPDTETLINNARVLLVDDEPYNIDALKIILRYFTEINPDQICDVAYNG